MVVDLPAPLGPRNPVTRPGRTAKETSSTATVLSPYRLVKALASIIVVPFLAVAWSWRQACARGLRWG